jgi:hypothetical protein|tara:strand:- start:1866 stop:2264 length:399 start_codon:yes stop_codon:yes gene_type:complete
MKHEKKTSVQGEFAKKGEDIKDQDIITFVTGATEVEGKYGPQMVFRMKMAGGEEKNLPLNQTSMNNMIDAYGDEDDKWVGVQAKVWMNRENVQGKFVQVIYLTHPDKDLEGNSMDGAEQGEPPVEGYNEASI